MALCRYFMGGKSEERRKDAAIAARRLREVKKAEEKEARRALRAGTSLKQRQVSELTRERYVVACNALVEFWKTYECGPKLRPSIDMAVAEYIEHLFQEGDTVGMASNALAAMQYFYPESIGKLKYSWKLLGLWRILEPPSQVTPFTNLTVLALAGAALDLGHNDLCALILLGFDRFLRSGELFTLRKSCVSFGAGKVVITLQSTKTSKRKGIDEMVTVTSPLVIKALTKACKPLRDADLILQRPVSSCRILFKSILDIFELDDGTYNFYSLRRGGATSFFFKSGSMDETIVVGRWEHSSTARIYINQSAASAAEIRYSANQIHRMRTAAAFLKAL